MTAKYGILRRNFHLQIFACLSKKSYGLLKGANDVALVLEQKILAWNDADASLFGV